MHAAAASCDLNRRQVEEAKATGICKLVLSDAPMQMLADLFKHLIVLEEPGLFADWDVRPFDLAGVLRQHRDVMIQKDRFCFDSPAAKLLYFTPVTVSASSKACLTNPPEKNRSFIRLQTNNGKVDSDRIVCAASSDRWILDFFKLQTASAIYTAVKAVLDCMVSRVREVDGFVTRAFVQQLELETLTSQSELADVITDAGFFRNLYKHGLEFHLLPCGVVTEEHDTADA